VFRLNRKARSKVCFNLRKAVNLCGSHYLSRFATQSPTNSNTLVSTITGAGSFA